MNKPMRLLSILLTAVAVIALSGCAKQPTELISSVDQAFASADEAQSAVYAESELTTAREALAAARAELDTQNQKFALTRSYKEATRLYTEAQTKAQEAQRVAEVNKVAARTAATEAVAVLHSQLDEANELLDQLGECPRRAKDMAADTAALEAQIGGFASAVPAIEKLVDHERLFDARSQAEALSGQVSTVAQDMRDALQRLGCSAARTT